MISKVVYNVFSKSAKNKILLFRFYWLWLVNQHFLSLLAWSIWADLYIRWIKYIYLNSYFISVWIQVWSMQSTEIVVGIVCGVSKLRRIFSVLVKSKNKLDSCYKKLYEYRKLKLLCCFQPALYIRFKIDNL